MDFAKPAPMQQAEAVQKDKAVWCTPKENFIKVNFGAAFHADLGAVAWGCIFRTDQGGFLAEAAGKLDYLSSPLHAEAAVCIKSVEAGLELGLHRVTFESDSLNLVNAPKSREHDSASIGVLLRETRSLCQASFDSFEFHF
ncbi:NAC domain-containing protein 78 [Hordeum vulgare]|nr:NAC domain-containing protein 78 [Hordeum vulgare]